MSAKDVEDLKRKVFYIDRAVTPFLNVQVMKLYKMNSELTLRVKELENKILSLSSDNSENESKQEEDKTLPKKKKVVKKTEITNDIRTITLE
jgi:hypothetical protein